MVRLLQKSGELVRFRFGSPSATDGVFLNNRVQDSYFVIRKPQTMVLFVIRKLLSIGRGTVSILKTLRNTNYETDGGGRGLRITNHD